MPVLPVVRWIKKMKGRGLGPWWLVSLVWPKNPLMRRGGGWVGRGRGGGGAGGLAAEEAGAVLGAAESVADGAGEFADGARRRGANPVRCSRYDTPRSV